MIWQNTQWALLAFDLDENRALDALLSGAT
jgi:hypothetical protein